VNFFQPTLKAGASRDFTVMLVNDEPQPVKGRLSLTLETRSGNVLAKTEQPFALAELGDQRLQVPLAVPTAPGDCVLKAVARSDGRRSIKPTVCRRWLTVVE
jgi:hypothetical protein